METKTCSNCKHDLSINKFGINRSRKGGLQIYCKKCQREKVQSHYESNKKYYSEKARKREAKIKEFIRKSKERPCTDCDIQYEYWKMEFDHIKQRGKKEFILSKGKKFGSFKKVEQEIAKCDVVCVLCHRDREHKRGWR